MARHLTFPLVGLAKRSSSVRWLARFMAGWYWFSVPIASILAPQPRIMPSYTSPDRPCVSQPKLHARRDSANIPHLHVELHALASRQIMRVRSEEHTSELQSLMRISYAVFCLKKKTTYDT